MPHNRVSGRDVLSWRAYYPDEVFDSTAVRWQELPGDGLQVLALHRPSGNVVVSGGDWYWMEGGDWLYLPSDGWDGWLDRPDQQCGSCVKRGTAVSDEQFRSLYEAGRKWVPDGV